MTLHKALRYIRVFHHINQTTLANTLEISTTHISAIEVGKKLPSLKTLENYSKTFNLPLSSIFWLAEHIEAYEQNVLNEENFKFPEKLRSILIALSLKHL